MKVAIGGDVFVGSLDPELNAARISIADYHEADVRLVNLEQPLAAEGVPASKATLTGTPAHVAVLRSLNADAVTLANNHIHDLGVNGLTETLTTLGDSGIPNTGAGENLRAARAPLQLAAGLVVLAYCDFGKKHLSQVLTASETTPGTAPLRAAAIREDLDRLPMGTRALLVFHWGQEHVWFPPRDDVDLARTLLDDPRVALIVGMHCHRVQGILRNGDKRAYLSVGNFLFADFGMMPPHRMLPLKDLGGDEPRTTAYHSVGRPTFKKWPLVGRVGLVVLFDSATGKTRHVVSVRHRDRPEASHASALLRLATESTVGVLSWAYQLPPGPYRAVARVSSGLSGLAWNLRVVSYKFRSQGLRTTWRDITRITASRWQSTGSNE